MDLVSLLGWRLIQLWAGDSCALCQPLIIQQIAKVLQQKKSELHKTTM